METTADLAAHSKSSPPPCLASSSLSRSSSLPACPPLYLLSVSDNYRTPQPTPFLSSLFSYTKKPTILHLLVSLVTVLSLTHALSGKITIFLAQSLHRPLTRSLLYAAWMLLCLFQVCVGLGIEGSIAAGIDGSGFGQECSFLGRVIFLFGLHETTLFWGRTVVKPVVDDTIFGYRRKEMWVEKVVVGLSYGTLWWCRLREEVESLVVVPQLKRELMTGIGAANFVGWGMKGILRKVNKNFNNIII